MQAAPKDTGRPQVSIIGIASPRAGATNTSTSRTVDPVLAFGTADVLDAIDGALVTSHTTTVSLTNPLVSGDRLTLKSSRIKDNSGNLNSAKSGTAIKAQASPRITSVLMSELKHSMHHSWTRLATAAVDAVDAVDAVMITAKADGDAAGNGWSMVFDRASTYSAEEPLDIGVRVDPRGKRVTVRFDNGPVTATLGDLIAALNGDGEFAALFSAGFTSCSLAASNNASSAVLGLVAARNVAAGFDDSGRTVFAIEVKFNSFVDVVRNPQLLEDLLAATRVRTRPNAAESAADGNSRVQAAATGGDNTAAAGGLTIFADLNADSPALPSVTTSTAPTRSVRYEFETSQVRYLPMARDLVQTSAGNDAQSALAGSAAYSEIIADAGVATGYAADAPAPGATGVVGTAQDRVDEDLNGSSQRRITMTSSVKTP